MNNSKAILDKVQAAKKLRRMALEIAERNADISNIVLAGIRENGFFIALIIAEHLKDFFNGDIQVIELNINKKNPIDISFSVVSGMEGCTVILIDDVANSGRTMQYALQPLLQLLPASIQTLALVERTHKLFPVSIDYTGISVSTKPGENIVVDIQNGNVISATLEQLKHQL